MERLLARVANRMSKTTEAAENVNSRVSMHPAGYRVLAFVRLQIQREDYCEEQIIGQRVVTWRTTGHVRRCAVQKASGVSAMLDGGIYVRVVIGRRLERRRDVEAGIRRRWRSPSAVSGQSSPRSGPPRPIRASSAARSTPSSRARHAPRRRAFRAAYRPSGTRGGCS